MFQGLYTITSGILTQNRKLNVISNNMANTGTAGYKRDEATITTFKDALLNRTEAKQREDIGPSSGITTIGKVQTHYGIGAYEDFENPLTFALGDKGFFTIQTNNGNVYTRSGSFAIDDDGYLSLPGVGRVLGENGPIQLETDRIICDGTGNIYTQNGNQLLGKLAIVDFPDREGQLSKQANGVFKATGTIEKIDAPTVYWKKLESSNVEPIDEMTKMMSSQRNLQSDLQMIKIYDQLIGKIVTSLGPTQ